MPYILNYFQLMEATSCVRALKLRYTMASRFRCREDYIILIYLRLG